MKIKLDIFEQQIENEAESYQPILPPKRHQIESLLKRAQKAHNINLRINKDELNLLKQRAEKEGLPYQTLLSSILHKYLTNQLIESDGVVRLLDMMKKKA